MKITQSNELYESRHRGGRKFWILEISVLYNLGTVPKHFWDCLVVNVEMGVGSISTSILFGESVALSSATQ